MFKNLRKYVDMEEHQGEISMFGIAGIWLVILFTILELLYMQVRLMNNVLHSVVDQISRETLL